MAIIENLNNYAQSLLKDIEGWKNKISAAINTKGGQADPDSSFDQLADDIATIPDINLTGWTFLDDYKPTNLGDFIGNIKNVVSVKDDTINQMLGYYTFGYCYSLRTVNLPALTTIMGNGTFFKCTSLTTVDLSALTTIIGTEDMAYTFNNCIALESINLPLLTTITGASTFSFCYALESINLPLLTTITGNDTFGNDRILTTVDLPTLTTISGNRTFTTCDSLTTLNLPALTTISGNQTFYKCISLMTIDLPALTIISGAYTLGNCNSLKKVTFGVLTSMSEPFGTAKDNLINITIGMGTDIGLDFSNWTATNVIAEGQSGIDELNANLYNNLLTKLYDHSTDGVTRTLRIGWLTNVTAENIAYATAKGWTLIT